MRRFAFIASAAAMLALPLHAVSQSQQDLNRGSANTDNVVNYGMNYGQQRFSTGQACIHNGEFCFR